MFSMFIRLVPLCLLFSAATSTSELRTETEWRVVAARCFARCLTFDPDATQVREEQIE